MHRFWKSLTLPLLKASKPRTVVEIGAGQGYNTKLLWSFCKEHSSVLHIIEPVPSFSEKDICGVKETERVLLHKKLSLTALPAIHNIDVALIDGDHNWYTVYCELNILADLSKQDGRPFPLVLFHDVSWPYARRDLYYNPETIPKKFRHDCAQKGMFPRQVGLSDIGFNSELYNALHEGGPRNGVLTAIEDFLDETNEFVHLYTIPAFHGYGILVAEARFTFCSGLRKQLAGLLPSESVRLLFADLEEERLEITSNLMKRDQAIAKKDTAIVNREKRLAAFESQVQQLQQIITHQDQAIAEKDQAIAKKDQAIAEKDQAIAKKDQAIAKKDQAIAHYHEELYSVYTSRSWRYTTPLRKIGTLIRRVLRLPHKPRIRAVIKRAYFMLPAFIRKSRLFENLKSRFKSKEVID